ncbi:Rad3-related DNA helicase [Giardia duodenalis]|uniref:Rad3-related DNA helicase n=1 Tax=Giardia intestinalis (strain ATCC 50803 / WB clone C6) TaxID=184922 RepID=A8BI67_GIAIC|nr:Rad3-related DNA helicase [Giardia intestinalis]KAE8305683.1 Rad3-related DNA helicase [Giardia intestinalis]|eukprot:XP_001706782.1 CHL1-like protein [Giardia lamblia ATCC 50803]
MLAFFPFSPYAVQQEGVSFLKRCIANKVPAFLDAPTGTGKTAMLFHTAWDWINSLENLVGTHSKVESVQSGASTKLGSVNKLPDWAVDASEQAAAELVSASRHINRAFVGQLLHIAESYANPDALKTLLEYASKKHTDPSLTAEPLRKQAAANSYSFLFAFLGLDKILSLDTYLSLTQPHSAIDGRGHPENGATGYLGKGCVLLSTRTHAQIAQLVEAFRRFRGIIEKQGPQKFDFSTAPVVSLAGRDTYCLQSSSGADLEDLGELCEDLRKNSRCNYYSPAKVLVGTALCLSGIRSPSAFRERCSALGVCPYYSARHAAMHASVVLLSHAMLVEELHGAAGSLGLLESAPLLLLVDEAHAMPGALDARNSCTVSEDDLDCFIKALNKYLLQTRLGLPNPTARLLDRLATVLGIIRKYLSKTATCDVLTPITELLTSLRLRGFDFCEALNLLLLNRIPQKLCGLCKESDMTDKPRQRIYSVVSMIRILAEIDTRELYKTYVTGDRPRTLHLYKFSSPVDSKTRSPFRRLFNTSRDGRRDYEAQICFVSGTLGPFSYYSRELLGQPADPNSCCSIDHVAAPSRTLIQQVSLTTKATGQQKALFVASSWTPEQVDVVFQNIMEIAKSGRDCTGTLVFFPSYRIVEKIRDRFLIFSASLTNKSVPAVFFERAGESVDKLMETYALALGSSRCILCASAGARVSEGLDFKDNLCRRLVVVGIPFPNLGDPIVREKHRQRGEQFLMDHAFTLVNQCMGRGIRHKDDWCSFILFDSRFAEHTERLSSWIRNRVQPVDSIEGAIERIREFEATFA